MKNNYQRTRLSKVIDEIKKEILSFIEEESNRIQYGKLYIEMNVVEGKIVDMDVDTKRKKKFNYKKLDKTCTLKM